jgi:hypothetical protein
MMSLAIHALRRLRTGSAIAAVVLVGCAALAPAAAQAGVGLSVTPTFPTDSTVGQTGLAASLTITNANTGLDLLATVCNSGDAAPCPMNTEGITLLGSCAAQGGDASCIAADPGVFAISPTATGASGTACAGMAFAVTPIAGPFGKVRFTPAAGANVSLLLPGLSCRIDFTVAVLKTPATDALAAAAGQQTIQVADASERSNNGTAGFARGSQTGTTVNPPPPVVPPPPVTPPVVPPPPLVCTPPPGPAPAGGKLCVPTRGSAVVSGRSGCQSVAFDVRVRGSEIRRVVFAIDGKKVKTLTTPNQGVGYVLRITPRQQRHGTHRVTAAVSFTAASGTHKRTMRVTYQRCGRRVVSPVFTG